MASFPTYDSTTNINIPSPVLQKGAENRFDDIKDVVGTMQDVTQTLSDAHNMIQGTARQTAADVALGQLKQQRRLDPDSSPARDEYYAQAVQDIQKNLPSVDNQEYAAKINADIEHNSNLAWIEIQDEGQAKRFDQNVVTTNVDATQKGIDISNAKTDAQAQSIIDNATNNWNAQNGITLHPDNVKANYNTMYLGAIKGNIDKISSQDTSDYGDVEKLGPGKTIDASQHLDLQAQKWISDYRDKHISELKKQSTQADYNTTISTLKSIVKNDPSLNNPDVINKIRAANPKLGDAIELVRSNPEGYTPTSQKDIDLQNSLTNDDKTGILDSENLDQLNDSLVTYANDKDVTAEQLAIVIQAVETIGKNLQPVDKVMPNAQNNLIAGGIKNLQEFSKTANGAVYQMFYDYFTAVNKGSTPAEAVNTAIKNKVVRDYPETAALPRTPNMYVGKDSTIRVIFPRTNRKEEPQVGTNTDTKPTQ